MKTYQKPTIKTIIVDGGQLLAGSPHTYILDGEVTGPTGVRRRNLLDEWDEEE